MFLSDISLSCEGFSFPALGASLVAKSTQFGALLQRPVIGGLMGFLKNGWVCDTDGSKAA
jgi:hypothetical protein